MAVTKKSEKFVTGIAISPEVAREIRSFADRECRNFSQSVEYLCRRALESQQVQEPISQER